MPRYNRTGGIGSSPNIPTPDLSPVAAAFDRAASFAAGGAVRQEAEAAKAEGRAYKPNPIIAGLAGRADDDARESVRIYEAARFSEDLAHIRAATTINQYDDEPGRAGKLDAARENIDAALSRINDPDAKRVAQLAGGNWFSQQSARASAFSQRDLRQREEAAQFTQNAELPMVMNQLAQSGDIESLTMYLEEKPEDGEDPQAAAAFLKRSSDAKALLPIAVRRAVTDYVGSWRFIPKSARAELLKALEMANPNGNAEATLLGMERTAATIFDFPNLPMGAGVNAESFGAGEAERIAAGTTGDPNIGRMARSWGAMAGREYAVVPPDMRGGYADVKSETRETMRREAGATTRWTLAEWKAKAGEIEELMMSRFTGIAGQEVEIMRRGVQFALDDVARENVIVGEDGKPTLTDRQEQNIGASVKLAAKRNARTSDALGRGGDQIGVVALFADTAGLAYIRDEEGEEVKTPGGGHKAAVDGAGKIMGWAVVRAQLEGVAPPSGFSDGLQPEKRAEFVQAGLDAAERYNAAADPRAQFFYPQGENAEYRIINRLAALGVKTHAILKYDEDSRGDRVEPVFDVSAWEQMPADTKIAADRKMERAMEIVNTLEDARLAESRGNVLTRQQIWRDHPELRGVIRAAGKEEDYSAAVPGGFLSWVQDGSERLFRTERALPPFLESASPEYQTTAMNMRRDPTNQRKLYRLTGGKYMLVRDAGGGVANIAGAFFQANNLPSEVGLIDESGQASEDLADFRAAGAEAVSEFYDWARPMVLTREGDAVEELEVMEGGTWHFADDQAAEVSDKDKARFIANAQDGAFGLEHGIDESGRQIYVLVPIFSGARGKPIDLNGRNIVIRDATYRSIPSETGISTDDITP